MKAIVTTLLAIALFAAPKATQASGNEGDTVVIELNNKSKIVIYTADKEALKDMEQYDINKMIQDLNSALGSKKIEKVELLDKDGNKYMKDTTLVFGDGEAKSRIKIGNLELLVDADDWDELEDEFDDDDIPVRRYDYEENKIDRTRHFFNVDIGMNNWLDGGEFPDAEGQPYTVKPWGSWYFALNSVNRTWVSGPLFLDWGFGFSWYNWKMEDPNIAIVKGPDNIEFVDARIANPDFSGVKSRLTAPYVNVQMVPMLDFAKGRRRIKNLERGSVSFRTYKKQGIRFGVGGYVGYRIGGNTKLVFREDGEKQKDKTKGNYYLENLRYGIRAQVGYKGLDLFATYDLNNVFAGDRGPVGSQDMNAITVGITL